MKAQYYIYLGIATLIVAIFVFRKKKAPVTGRLTSQFGNRTHPIQGTVKLHNGIDIAAPTGTPIHAPALARVEKVYSTATGGKQIILKHLMSDTITGYAHLSKQDVSVGDLITPGQRIGLVGNTGQSTGAHLHFTVKKKGKFVDPLKYYVV